MGEISVEEVVPGSVRIRVGNVLFQFFFNDTGKLVFVKNKESRVYDPAALWVSDYLFAKVCRQAAAILRCQNHKEKGGEMID